MLYSRYSPVKQCEQRDVTHLKNDIEIDAIITPDLRVQPFFVPVAVLVARIAVSRGRMNIGLVHPEAIAFSRLERSSSVRS